MSANFTRRQPSFFWQGVMILLPVIMLAVFGLILLRQDERAAEQDARNRAVENVQSLALAMRTSVDEELRQFLVLQSNWRSGLELAGQSATDSSVFQGLEDKLRANVKDWEHDHPGLKFADMATPYALIYVDGRQIYPPEFPPVSVPPIWFLELSQQQRLLWEKLRLANGLTEINQRRQDFLDCKPSEPARAAALRLHWSPQQQMDEDAISTETGVSFEQIACYQLLSAPNAQLTSNLLQTVWWQTMEHPSFLSPKLLELAGALTNRAEPYIQREFSWMRQIWNGRSKARAWLEPLRTISALTNQWNLPARWACWTGVPGDEALAILQSQTFSNGIMSAAGIQSQTNDAVEQGYWVNFFPRQFLESVFTRDLVENKSLIPDYVCVGIEVEGKQLCELDPKTSTEVQPLLSSAAQTASYLMTSDGARYELQFYLASRERMLASAHRRAMLFGVLILGAVITALIGYFTARRAFYRQLQLNELKSNFVSSVSHELRAPIASVRLMAENLAGGKVAEAPKQNEYFRFIVQECRRLSSLIENVLDFSRIEQGRKQYEFEPTDLVALTQTTVRLMEAYATEKGVKLELKSEIGNRKSEMDLDGRAIQQALVNLIDNAIKHSPKEETVTVGIEVVAAVCDRRLENEDANRRSQTAATVRLFVSDHGPGIPQAEQEKIFERFYRRGSELRRETQGVGIGLSIVKHIVEAHGGRVTVQSEAGHGSRFTIELSFYQQEQTEITESKP